MKRRKEIQLSDNALAVLRRRYLIKDGNGKVTEEPSELFWRVAGFIAEGDRQYGADDEAVEKTAGRFYDMMASLEFLPNSPTLMNAGRSLGQLSACFVLPVGDSMEEIFETNKHAALIHKSGGGTGFSFSRLRPRNSIVASTSGVASGPVSFMKVYNASTEAVKQGGTRRGANMAVLRVDHPDILEFISCKSDTSEITNFNISVAITDSFMEALKVGGDFPLIDPRIGEQHVVDGKQLSLDASELFEKIVDQAWKTGEPGIVFIDRMNRLNPTSPSETIEATNPCGEQPLPPYDSCNLGSVNLGAFVLSPLGDDYDVNQPDDGINWERLGKVVRNGVHFLDNVIDQNRYPLIEIEAQSKKNRRIGLGVMGWADMLIKLRLPYDSDEAMSLADRVMSFISCEAKKQSSTLAKTRGRFENWDGSLYASEGVAMRNATVTTIAPTGTIALIANCSSGIEPYYSLAYERNVMDGTRLMESNGLFEQVAREGGFYSKSLMRKLSLRRSISDLDEIPESVRSLFVTATDVTPVDHIRMQSVFQKHVDSSVSKTINLPESSTASDVRDAFLKAWELECKGVTIYRDNSRPNQVLSTKPVAKRQSGSGSESGRLVESRPTVLGGITEKIQTGYGNLYVTVNVKDGRPFEMFAQIGKSGYTTMADTEAICRMVSLALRAGVDVSQVIRQLRGIGGSSQIYSNGAKISSIPDAIAQVLHRHFGSGEATSENVSEICPDCSGAMKFDSGCFVCDFCGYSNC